MREGVLARLRSRMDPGGGRARRASRCCRWLGLGELRLERLRHRGLAPALQAARRRRRRRLPRAGARPTAARSSCGRRSPPRPARSAAASSRSSARSRSRACWRWRVLALVLAGRMAERGRSRGACARSSLGAVRRQPGHAPRAGDRPPRGAAVRRAGDRRRARRRRRAARCSPPSCSAWRSRRRRGPCWRSAPSCSRCRSAACSRSASPARSAPRSCAPIAARRIAATRSCTARARRAGIFQPWQIWWPLGEVVNVGVDGLPKPAAARVAPEWLVAADASADRVARRSRCRCCARACTALRRASRRAACSACSRCCCCCAACWTRGTPSTTSCRSCSRCCRGRRCAAPTRPPVLDARRDARGVDHVRAAAAGPSPDMQCAVFLAWSLPLARLAGARDVRSRRRWALAAAPRARRTPELWPSPAATARGRGLTSTLRRDRCRRGYCCALDLTPQAFAASRGIGYS